RPRSGCRRRRGAAGETRASRPPVEPSPAARDRRRTRARPLSRREILCDGRRRRFPPTCPLETGPRDSPLDVSAADSHRASRLEFAAFVGATQSLLDNEGTVPRTWAFGTGFTRYE